MALTDIAIKKAKLESGSKLKKLSDGQGLQLWLTEGGGKRWRLAYRFDGKQKLLALGTYPDISLKDARISRDEAKKRLATGVDPMAARKADKAPEAVNTFNIVADELLVKKQANSTKIPPVTCWRDATCKTSLPN